MAKIHNPLDERAPAEYNLVIDRRTAMNLLDRAFWSSKMMVEVLHERLENVPLEEVGDEPFLSGVAVAFEHLNEDISRAMSFYEG